MAKECRTESDCPHAEESAKKAVKMVFAILGVNIDEPREVEEFRENLRFGASMRRAADKGWMVFIGVVAVGVGSVIWVGITSILGSRQ